MNRIVLPVAFLTSFMLAPAVGATSYVDDAQPIFEANCNGCHTTAGSGAHNIGSSYEDGQLPADTCEDMTVAECSVARIADGTMPMGQNCEGVVADDADNADVCVTESEFAILEAWLEAGAPEEAAADAGCESDDDCGEGEMCVDDACVGNATNTTGCESDDECTEEGFVCTDAGLCAMASEDNGEASASTSDDGGCQTGGGSLGWLMVMLAGLALVATRRRSVLDQ